MNKCSSPRSKSSCNKRQTLELRIVELVNSKRKVAGLNPLQIDNRLGEMAREKSKDMVVNGFFSHKSPAYGSPFQMMRTFGITFQYAGENIASGYRTPEEVVKGWMDSPGHRANILKPEYTHIGIGYFYKNRGQYRHFWVQEFIGQWQTSIDISNLGPVKVNYSKISEKPRLSNHKKVASANLKTKKV